MQSKTAAKHNLEVLIERGHSEAAEVVARVMNHQPLDRLSRGGELHFRPDPSACSI